MKQRPCKFRFNGNICSKTDMLCDNCGATAPLTFEGVVFIDDVAYKPQDIRDMKARLEKVQPDLREIERFDRDLFRAHDGEFVKWSDVEYHFIRNSELEAKLQAVDAACCRFMVKQISPTKRHQGHYEVAAQILKILNEETKNNA